MSALLVERPSLAQTGLEFPTAVVGDCTELAQITELTQRTFPFSLLTSGWRDEEPKQTTRVVALFLGALHGSIFTSQFLHYHKDQQVRSFEITSLQSNLSLLGSTEGSLTSQNSRLGHCVFIGTVASPLRSLKVPALLSYTRLFCFVLFPVICLTEGTAKVQPLAPTLIVLV